MCDAETMTESLEECTAFMIVGLLGVIAPLVELEGMVLEAALGCVDDTSAQTKCMDSKRPLALDDSTPLAPR